MDFTTLLAAVDFSTVFTALAAIGVALAGLFIGIRSTKIVLGLIRS